MRFRPISVAVSGFLETEHPIIPVGGGGWDLIPTSTPDPAGRFHVHKTVFNFFLEKFYKGETLVDDLPPLDLKGKRALDPHTFVLDPRSGFPDRPVRHLPPRRSFGTPTSQPCSFPKPPQSSLRAPPSPPLDGGNLCSG